MLYHYVILQVEEDVVYDASVASTVAPAGTTHARITSTTDSRFKTESAAPVAIATSRFLPAGVVEFIPCLGTHKIAFIKESAGGKANVTFVKAF